MINAEKNRINKVLSNAEIQAMITAIGTGIGDEFDISKLRYHRVIVMTDADVDGAHIRTLILTFLYRQMQELVERGHIYIAVPPLYRVKLGNQEHYVEKESQFEEILVRERVTNMEVTDRAGATQKLTEARWGRFARALHRVRGLVGPAPLRLRQCRRRLRRRAPARRDGRRPSLADVEQALGGDRAERLRARRRSRPDRTAFEVKVIERETSAAIARDGAGRAARARRSTPACAGRTRKLADIVGPPPFTLAAGKKRAAAETFEELRARGARAREGGHAGQPLQGSRRDERRASSGRRRWIRRSRMLVRVEVEDAAAASAIFSTLMGDQVEPRREFIEQNAQDVRFLDV